MRNKLISFITLFLVFCLSSLVFSSPGTEKNSSQPVNDEVKSTKNKAKELRWEFSTSASLEVRTENSSTTTIISLPVRVGYFVSRKLEIEPEVNYIYTNYGGDDSESEMLFLANLAYNRTSSSPVVPFILAGAGILRYSEYSCCPIWSPIIYYETKFALNAGVGIKWFVADRVALRLEYRVLYYPYNGEKVFHHKFFTGISLF